MVVEPSEMIVRSPKSASRARHVWSTRMLAYKRKLFRRRVWLQLLKTYPFKISMDHTLAMHIDQALCDIAQLWEPQSSVTCEECRSLNRERTSSNRFASRCAATNWFMFPFGIHSDTIENSVSVIITPRSGNTFGCRRAFHDTNSLQNPCVSYGQCSNGYV